MFKKTAVLIVIALVFASLLSPVFAQTQSKITVLDSSASVDFPQKINFHLSARSEVTITDIRLRYTVERDSFAQVTGEAFVSFTPGTTIDINWTFDLIKIGGLPPGSKLDYWWTLKNAEDKTAETSPSVLEINDNRYRWQTLTEGMATIYWYEGNLSFAQTLMTATQQALAKLAQETGAIPVKPVRLYVYASQQDFQGALIFPQEWTGGVSFTGFGIIAIGISPSDLTWGKGAITHELTHLVIHQVTLNPYNEIPVWLDEGMAMYIQGPPDPQFTNNLNQAVADNTLLSVRSLSSPFSAYPDTAILSYAESRSIVEFLINTHGQSKILELLNTFKQGAIYDGALEKVFGFNMDGLNDLWRKSIGAQAQSTSEKVPVLR